MEKPLDTADFDALSYVWGEQTPTFPLRCNGQNLTVGRNLYEALNEYRCRGSLRGLWADAISINQRDDTEKTEQVRMMRDVYQAARNTTIWLGPFQSHDKDGLHLVERIYNKCKIDEDRYGKDSGFLHNDLDCKAEGIPQPLQALGINPAWRAIFNILDHPWFSRIWIVQELLVSQNPIIWRGQLTTSPVAMLWVANRIGGSGDINQAFRMLHESPNFYARGVALCHFRYDERNLYPIWIQMRHTRGMRATDVRDRYFALAGIVKGLPSHFIDYSRTFQEVACQVGLMTLLGRIDSTATTGLDFLADNPSQRVRSQHIQLPSWIPDFISDPSLGTELCYLYSTFRLLLRRPTMAAPEIHVVTEDPAGNSLVVTSPKFPFLYPKVHSCCKLRRALKSQFPNTSAYKALGSRVADQGQGF